nr:hypothetical protein [Tanacetum cinerariifolium]
MQLNLEHLDRLGSMHYKKYQDGPPQDFDIRQLIREECCIEVYEEQKQNMENTILELVEICLQKELLCMHDNVDDLIESALNSKLLSINSNSQQDNKEYDVPVCENSPICDDHSEIFSDSNNGNDISSDDDDFEDIDILNPRIQTNCSKTSLRFEGAGRVENSQSRDRSNSLNDNEEHYVQNGDSLENSSKEIDALNSNPEKEETPQDSNIRHLIREECYVEASEEQKQNMEDMMLELVKICHQKELLCMHDNVEDLIEIATILSTNEPEYSSSMGYENSNTTLEMESDEIMKSGVEKLVPILSENEVTLEDKRECDLPVSKNSPVCDDHSDFKNDDDISSDDDDFEDNEYVEASLSDSKIVSVEEENKLLSITHLISNIEYLNDNPTPDCVLNSFVSFPISEDFNNSLSDNFSPVFKTFCDHMEETRSGNTTHADNSLPEYASFCFKIESDQERLINVMKDDIPDDSSNDPLLEKADLFLAFDNSIPPGIVNSTDDSEGDIRFLEDLLIDDSILSHESSDSNFEDNPSIPRPPPEPPHAETDAGEEIPVVMNDKDKFDEDYYFFMFVKVFYLLFAKSEDTIFDPGISI